MQRWLFRRELEKLNGQPVFYLDECGVDHRRYREYGRAPKGERIYEAVAGKRRERTSIIAAYRQGRLVAPLVFQGSCNTEVVDVYFEKVLLPALPPGSVIVLDNARFHQSPTTQRLVAAAGCQLLFLPAYSPDLNPIEQVWAAFKSRLRKNLSTTKTHPFLSPICPNVIVNCYSRIPGQISYQLSVRIARWICFFVSGFSLATVLPARTWMNTNLSASQRASLLVAAMSQSDLKAPETRFADLMNVRSDASQ